jgi:flagellar assembly protein FliH
VAVEEKKSLSNSGHKTIDRFQKNYRLHCFPNIPVDDTTGNRRCLSKENRFKRSDFKNIDPSCPDPIEDSEDNKNESSASSIDEIEKKAYQQGFDEGQKAGIESRSQEIEPVLKSLHQAFVQLQNLRTEIYNTIEKEVVKLALAIARKVVCQEVKTNKEVVLCVAKEALSKIEVPGEIKVKLNPSDLQFIKETKDQLTNFLHNIENVTFEAEESISSGGCVIETNLGEIDARIEKQFNVVEEMFQAEMDKSALGDREME